MDKGNFSSSPQYSSLSWDLKNVSSSNKYNLLPVQLLSNLAPVIEFLWYLKGNHFGISTVTPNVLQFFMFFLSLSRHAWIISQFRPRSCHYQFFITPSFESIVWGTWSNLKRTISSDENKQYRQCTYNVTLRRVRVPNIVAEKAISITYPDYVSLALFTQHAKHMSHIVNCGLPASTMPPVFLHYYISGRIFEKKKKIIECKMCFDFLYSAELKYFSF